MHPNERVSLGGWWSPPRTIGAPLLYDTVPVFHQQELRELVNRLLSPGDRSVSALSASRNPSRDELGAVANVIVSSKDADGLAIYVKTCVDRHRWWEWLTPTTQIDMQKALASLGMLDELKSLHATFVIIPRGELCEAAGIANASVCAWATEIGDNDGRRHLFNDTIGRAVRQWLLANEDDHIESKSVVWSRYGRIKDWDVSNVTNMSNLFYNRTFFNDDISGWDVSHVTNMDRMFYGADGFEGIDMKRWDVSLVTNMRAMFMYATAFNGDIRRWDVSSVTNMESMFMQASSFKHDLPEWDVSNVTNMARMFKEATVFNGDISTWKVHNVIDLHEMFMDAVSFDRDLSNWIIEIKPDDTSADDSSSDDSSACITEDMFEGTPIEDTVGRHPKRVRHAPDDMMQEMLEDGTSRRLGDDTISDAVGQWIADAAGWDSNRHSRSQSAVWKRYGHIRGWDVSNVTNMANLFKGTRFNDDISLWNVSGVTNMSGMFNNASYFNGDLSKWDVSRVTTMSHMFNGAINFQGSNMNNWTVSSVTNMSSMFKHASKFNDDISKWNVSSVRDMSDMFHLATKFEGIGLNEWTVVSVTNMQSMFKRASRFTGALSKWKLKPNGSRGEVNTLHMFTGSPIEYMVEPPLQPDNVKSVERNPDMDEPFQYGGDGMASESDTDSGSNNGYHGLSGSDSDVEDDGNSNCRSIIDSESESGSESDSE
jgi:surface protein